MSSVRAKFFVTEIRHIHGSGNAAAEVKLAPVYANGEANKEWSKYTPSGEIRMLITNMEAVERFDLGKEYFVDFTPAA